jgi:hypothetical protein
MTEDEKTRAMDLPSHLARRRSVENEHRYRRAVYRANEPKNPIAVTQEYMDEVGDENVKFPWD